MTDQSARPKSGWFKRAPLPPVQRSFEDWQAEQANDLRTPGQRGIGVGSPVQWRRRSGRVVVTERATVVAISDNTLTLLVKDVQARTCDVNVREIVSSTTEHLLLSEASRRALLADQTKPAGPA
jgi:hypothetical protein